MNEWMNERIDETSMDAHYIKYIYLFVVVIIVVLCKYVFYLIFVVAVDFLVFHLNYIFFASYALFSLDFFYNIILIYKIYFVEYI